MESRVSGDRSRWLAQTVPLRVNAATKLDHASAVSSMASATNVWTAHVKSGRKASSVARTSVKTKQAVVPTHPVVVANLHRLSDLSYPTPPARIRTEKVRRWSSGMYTHPLHRPSRVRPLTPLHHPQRQGNLHPLLPPPLPPPLQQPHTPCPNMALRLALRGIIRTITHQCRLVSCPIRRLPDKKAQMAQFNRAPWFSFTLCLQAHIPSPRTSRTPHRIHPNTPTSFNIHSSRINHSRQ